MGCANRQPPGADRLNGNEAINGYASDDVLRGNAGNDTLWGHWGNDAYRYGKNDGKDLIYEFADEGADKVVLDADVAPQDVVLFRVYDEPANYPNGVLVVRVKTGDTEIRMPNFSGCFGRGGGVH